MTKMTFGRLQVYVNMMPSVADISKDLGAETVNRVSDSWNLATFGYDKDI